MFRWLLIEQFQQVSMGPLDMVVSQRGCLIDCLLAAKLQKASVILFCLLDASSKRKDKPRVAVRVNQ